MKIARFVATSFATNVYLVYDEEEKSAFIVDPAAPLPQLSELIEKEGLKLEYLILTHGHGDHTGGIAYFKEKYPDVKLLASRKERKMLYDRHMSMGSGGIVADLEVRGGDTLDVGPMHLEFIDCPGHTPGGMSILCGKVLFSGDTLFQASVGRTDLPGGSWEDLLDTIKNRLFVLPEDTVVLPGHMGQTTIAYEKRYNPFV